MNYQELPKLEDSISYLYLGHTILERGENAIVSISKEGRIPIPIFHVTCLLLGPGIPVIHAALVYGIWLYGYLVRRRSPAIR